MTIMETLHARTFFSCNFMVMLFAAGALVSGGWAGDLALEGVLVGFNVLISTMRRFPLHFTIGRKIRLT
jgi:hypothetical protein